MSPVRIAIIGGGAFVPRLCEALAREPTLPPLELRLAARRLDRLAAVATHAESRVRAATPAPRVPHQVRAFATTAEAAQDCEAVVLLLRVGGYDARAHDERFPGEFGAVGDEGLGLGGLANGYRTVPVITSLARDLARVAPRAWVLNLVAPLGVTTHALLDEGVRALGVCELPLVTLEGFARAAGVALDATTYRYAGTNHLGWFWDVLARDTATNAPIDVLARAQRNGAAIDPEVLARFGAAPLHYYYRVFDPAPAARLGMTPPKGRAQALSALSDALVESFRDDGPAASALLDERPTPWFDRATAPILAALLGGAAHRGFANVRNEAAIPELPSECVVEAAVSVGAHGVTKMSPGAALPPRVREFLRAALSAESHLLHAARTRDPARLADAVRALPLASPLADVDAIVRRIASDVAPAHHPPPSLPEPTEPAAP